MCMVVPADEFLDIRLPSTIEPCYELAHGFGSALFVLGDSSTHIFACFKQQPIVTGDFPIRIFTEKVEGM